MTGLNKIICAFWLSFSLVACSNPEADRALIDASKAGNIDMLNLAISDWGDVDAKGGKLMATPLHYSTVHGHTPIVERLLDKGADVKVTDANGETPLHDAATFGRIEIVKMLFTHKADVNSVTPEKKTPLDYAIEANAEDVIDFLKQNGGKTGSELSIHVAAQRSDNKAIQKHLNAKVDINSLDESGATPLDYAAKLDSESTANFLRQRGGKTSSELRMSSKQTAN